MKQLTAILLMTILLFNWGGYRLFTSIIEVQSSAQIVAAFEEQPAGSMETISLKIPSSLPYYTGTGNFEKVTGEIEINDVAYNYVQRKVTHDSIEYICVVNHTKTAVKKATDQYYKLISDVQHNSGKKDGSAKAKLLKWDCCEAGSFLFNTAFDKRSEVNSENSNKSFCSLSIAPPHLPPNTCS